MKSIRSRTRRQMNWKTATILLVALAILPCPASAGLKLAFGSLSQTRPNYARTISTIDIETGEIKDFAQDVLLPHHPESVTFAGGVWSPSGRFVIYRAVFRADTENEDGTFIYDRRLGQVERLFSGLGNKYSWSPDETEIAFSQRLAGNAVIRIVDRLTGSVRTIVSDQFNYEPAWHPSLPLIAFHRAQTEHAKPHLWTVSPDGSNLRDLMPTRQGSYWTPSWMGSGLNLVFFHLDGLYTLDAPSDVIEKMASVRGVPLSSPDGQWIAVSTAGMTPQDTAIGIVPTGGGDAIWFDTGNMSYLRATSWVPDYQVESVIEAKPWGEIKRQIRGR